MLYAIQSALITLITTMYNYICFMHVNKMKCSWKYELSKIIILRIKCLSKQQLVQQLLLHTLSPTILLVSTSINMLLLSWLNPQQHIVMVVVVVFSD